LDALVFEFKKGCEIQKTYFIKLDAFSVYGQRSEQNAFLGQRVAVKM